MSCAIQSPRLILYECLLTFFDAPNIASWWSGVDHLRNFLLLDGCNDGDASIQAAEVRADSRPAAVPGPIS